MRETRPRGAGPLRRARQAVPRDAAPDSDGRAGACSSCCTPTRSRSLSEVPLPDGEVREPELKLAKQLIDQIASRDLRADAVPRRGPGAHPGRHREEGAGTGHREAAEPTAEPARIIDLMAALKASLGKGERRPRRRRRAPAEAQRPLPAGARRSPKRLSAAQPNRSAPASGSARAQAPSPRAPSVVHRDAVEIDTALFHAGIVAPA